MKFVLVNEIALMYNGLFQGFVQREWLMRFAAAGSTSTGLPVSPSAVFVWRAPGKPVRVRLRLEVIDRLEAEALKGLWAVPKRGAEVGGVLLGTGTPGGGMVVEDFEPAPCEYRRGPSYHLSEGDRRNLEQILSRWRGHPCRRVVGYYRSHTRAGLCLGAEDLALISQYFSDPSSVFLVIKPSAARPSVAGFFLWEDGKVRGESSDLEFPFNRKALLEANLIEAGLPVEQEQPVQRRRMAAWFLKILHLGNGRAPGGGPAAPYLRVEKTGDFLRVSWKGSAPAIGEAQRAVLWIEDGQYRKELELDPGQLRSGSVAYLPATGDVSFRLELQHASTVLSQSLRVLSPGSPTPEFAPGLPRRSSHSRSH
jgi:hypothetical protein